MWMGVECPCPPVRNDIVTTRHLINPNRLAIHTMSQMKSLVRRTKDGRSTNVTKVGDTDVTSHLLTKPNTVGGQSGKHLPDGELKNAPV